MSDHIEDFQQVLLHLLMADLLRASVRLLHVGELEVEGRLLAFIEAALARGDAPVVNAVRVSFVEHVGASPGEIPVGACVRSNRSRFDEGRWTQARFAIVVEGCVHKFASDDALRLYLLGG